MNDWFIIICFTIVVWLIIRYYKKNKIRYIDNNGYLRDGFNVLIHRRIAYKFLYDYPKTHDLRFGEYQVHHIDRNKQNNSPDNLQIVTREEHRLIHGFLD